MFACGSGRLNFDNKTKWPRQPNQATTGARKKWGRDLAVLLMGTRAEFSRELRIKVDSGEQFGISLIEQSKQIRE